MTAVEARMCVWRIFELDNDYTDRPPGDTGKQEFTIPIPQSEYFLKVLISEFPEYVRESLRAARARAPYVLREMFGAYNEMPLQEREAELESFYEQADLNDLDIQQRLYLTLEISQVLRIEVDQAPRFLWMHTARDLTEAMFHDIEKAAPPMLDAALPWLLPAIKDKLSLGRLIWSDTRAFLLIPGKAAAVAPRISAQAAGGLVAGAGWGDVAWTDFTDALQKYTTRVIQNSL
jgi:hypothetical protein